MRLVDYRKQAKMTQEELAIKAKVTRETISRLESGTRRPTPEVAIRLAKALDMDMETMWAVLYQESNASSAN